MVNVEGFPLFENDIIRLTELVFNADLLYLTALHCTSVHVSVYLLVFRDSRKITAVSSSVKTHVLLSKKARL